MRFSIGMVSYASVVISFLLLAGPVLILNAIAPNVVDHWTVGMLLSAGLFVIWLSIHAHAAFTTYRFASFEDQHDVAVLTERAIAEATEPRPVTVLRQPEKVSEPRPRTAAVARGSTLS